MLYLNKVKMNGKKVEEVNGEISESEWERLFGTGVEEMEIEAEPKPEKEIRYVTKNSRNLRI